MRVLIAVTHLLGAGHLTRAAAIGRAFAAAGHEVTLVSGGAPAPLIRLDGLRLVQLPPLRVVGTAFSTLLDSDGRAAGPDLLAERADLLARTLAATAPDALVTELYPFGRRALGREFLGLVEAATRMRPRPLILASIRDVLVAPNRADKVRAAHDLVSRFYDAVLVHGDPGLVPLDASWPVADGLRSRLHYTGYVDEAAAPDADTPPRAGILVSAGSSAAGLALCRAAAEAARARPDLGWRILAGAGIGEADYARLSRGLADGVVARARPGYRALLAQAAVSVSPCGYNTAVDLLAARTPAVLVPFEDGGETEQRLRAERLAARGLGIVLPEAELTAGRLINAVAAVRAIRPPSHGIDLGGAARTVAIVEDLLAARRRAGPAGGDRFDPLRGALDAAGHRGIRVPVWWRDDDAVAATPALDRLLDLAGRRDAPILVAAIPANVVPSLGARLRDETRVSLAVHGLTHTDHAASGAKPAEFGADRPLAALVADAAEGLRLARERLPESRLLPVFVPPWNRLCPRLAASLPGLGYRGLSAVAGPPVAGLVRADITFDPIDWRGTRSLADPDRLVRNLCDCVARAEPIGILTHHLAHDEAVWDFLAGLLAVLLPHPAVTIRDPRHLFLPAEVDGSVPPCSTSPSDRHARVA